MVLVYFFEGFKRTSKADALFYTLEKLKTCKVALDEKISEEIKIEIVEDNIKQEKDDEDEDKEESEGNVFEHIIIILKSLLLIFVYVYRDTFFYRL